MLDLVQHLDRGEIRRRRILAGMTQVALARASGTGATYLNDIERGRGTPSPTLLKRLAEALGCEITDLIRDEVTT